MKETMSRDARETDHGADENGVVPSSAQRSVEKSGNKRNSSIGFAVGVAIIEELGYDNPTAGEEVGETADGEFNDGVIGIFQSAEK